QRASLTVLATAVACGAAFYGVGRARLSQLVRYIPFAVMAGFLASTGWLMASGALNIIAETPLTAVGIDRLLSDPWRPELAFGVAVAALLSFLTGRVSGAILIPAVMASATLVVNAVL